MSRSATATIGRILGRAVGYLTQIFLARQLAPEGFGLFAIGWTLLRLFSIAGHLGLDFGVIKFGSQYWQKDIHKLRSVILVSIGGALLSGLFFGCLLYIFAPWLAEVFFKKPDLKPILQSLALAFPFATTLRVLAATGSLSGKMLGGAIAEDIAQPTLQLILFFAALSQTTTLNAALLSTVASYGLSVLFAAIYVARVIPGIASFGNYSMADVSNLFRFSLPAIAGVTLGAFNLWGDRLLIGYFGTEADTGIYQSISVITMFTTIILSGLKISMAPAIAAMHQSGNDQGVKFLARSVVRWALYISIPILIVVFMNAEAIILTAFGKGYQSGTTALLILTIGQVFYVMFGTVDQIFLMTGRQREWLTISAGIFILTIVFDAILIPRLHLIGASLVSSSMMLLLGCTSILVVRRRLDFWILDDFHGKILIAALGTASIVYLTSVHLSFDLIPNLLITSAMAGALFITLLWILGIEPSDNAALQKFIKKTK